MGAAVIDRLRRASADPSVEPAVALPAMTRDGRPIGVFDSGLGGLTVVRSLIDLLPDEDIVYFGDTGRFPYGPKPAEEVCKYSFEITDRLLDRRIKMLVVACNSAAAAALDQLQAPRRHPGHRRDRARHPRRAPGHRDAAASASSARSARSPRARTSAPRTSSHPMSS